MVRPHLNFDPENETFRSIRSIASIACTQGANIDSVVRLARDGHFSGGYIDESMDNAFYTNPNPKYGKWKHTELGQEVGQTLLANVKDAISLGIEFSDTSEARTRQADHLQELGDDEPVGEHHGVVIAFTGEALVPGSEFSEDLSTGEMELVIPKVPALTTVEGIYPVDQAASDELARELARLSLIQFPSMVA